MITMSFDSEDISMEDSEIINAFYQVATLASLLTGKKLNFQNLFLLILTDKIINKIAKQIIGIESDMEICRYLLDIDPSLVKSKTLFTFAQNYNINGAA